MRIQKDEAFLATAYILSLRSTCSRRKVGAVLVNGRGHILATGYNGVSTGDTHCIDTPCPGANLPSGTGLDKCFAIHAEQNALIQCSNVWDIDTVYCTDSPCMHCLKMLKNTGTRRIVFMREYPNIVDARHYWTRENPDRVKAGIPIREMEHHQDTINHLLRL